MSDRRLLRVRVQGEPDVIEAFLAAHPPGCERIERRGERLAIEVFLPAGEVQVWRRKLEIQVLYDAATRMKRLAKVLGRGDRFGPSAVPGPTGPAPTRARRP